MRNHSVDVVIPLHNKALYVEQAIRSVLAQTYPVRTIFVSDDASTDNGREIIRRLGQEDCCVKLIESPLGLASGPSAARNRAIVKCKADFIAFLDADDWWEADKLALQVPLFDNSSVGLVHCGCRTVKADGSPLNESLPPPIPAKEELFDMVRMGIYSVTGSASGVIMRRTLLESIGGFPENLRFGEDWDLWARAAQHMLFASVSLPLVNIRSLSTYARSLDENQEYLLWLRVFDRWETDDRFMRLARSEARRRILTTQLALFWQFRLEDLLFRFPQCISQEGGALGRQLYSRRFQYWIGLCRIVPLIIRAILKRVIQRIV